MGQTKIMLKQVKYDILIFFREPFFALPILILPAAFFAVYTGMYAKGGDVTSFGVYVPMYMLLISFLTVFFNIGTQYVSDKELGVIKRLTISPVKLYRVIMTYAIRGLLISILGFIEMTVIACIAYKIPFTSNWLLYFIAFICMVSVLMLVSLTLHGFFKNSRQVIPFTIITFQYVMFASGMLIPVERMGKGLRVLVYVNPVYHMNQCLIHIWEETTVKPMHILALVLTCVICFFLLMLQKRKKTC